MLDPKLTRNGWACVIALVMTGCASEEPAQMVADAGLMAATHCQDPLEACGQMCRDLSRDPANCGACGAACDDGEACRQGACVAAFDHDEPSASDAGAAERASVGSCCEAQGTPGCEDETVEACVCAIDRLCCAGAWDDRCVSLVESESCGRCGPAPSTACEIEEASDSAPSTLVGLLGAIDGPAHDALELSCGSFAEPDVAFAFTAPEAGSYTFTTEGSEIFDTVLAVLDGAACDGEELGCNDDDGSELTSRLVLELAADQEVLIAVESWGEEAGQVEVSISSGGANEPDADSCSASELPATLPTSVAGEASDEGDVLTPSCALYGSSGDAFYWFTAPESAFYRFDTRGSEADTVVQVLDGDCTGAELACNDDSELGGLAAIADVELSAGQTVLVNVDSFDGTGSYTLAVDRFDPSLEEPPATATGAGSCCSPQLSGGCADDAIVSCVCSVDDYCCNVAWDELCVEAVDILECGGC